MTFRTEDIYYTSRVDKGPNRYQDIQDIYQDMSQAPWCIKAKCVRVCLNYTRWCANVTLRCGSYAWRCASVERWCANDSLWCASWGHLDGDVLVHAVRAQQRRGVDVDAHGAQARRHHGDVHHGRVARQDEHEELVLAERRARVVRPHLHGITNSS